MNLKGGLGNQMFQYATARFLSEKYKTGIVLNTEYFHNIPNGDVPRKYQLDIYNIGKNCILKEKIYFIKKIRQKISQRFLSDEFRFYISNILLKMGFPTHLNGYFQSDKYFKDIRSILLSEFKLKIEISSEAKKIQDRIEESESVCMNIRRGDYLRPDYIKIYGVCNMEYYKNALNHISKNVKNPLICIFSDDPEWVKNEFKMDNVIYTGNDILKDYEQMYLMTKCKHNIIANSSFAWWGAWLNQNPNKIVIAPKKWVLKNEKNFKDIAPPSWIRI